MFKCDGSANPEPSHLISDDTNGTETGQLVSSLPSPIQPSENPHSGHHLYLSLDPKFDGEHDFEGLILCGDGLGRRIYESSRAWIRCLRLVTDLRPVLSHP